MASDHTRNDSESTFSFGVRELRLANAGHEADVNVPPLKVVDEGHRGVDPYNTSGAFDRTRNWKRVGKR